MEDSDKIKKKVDSLKKYFSTYPDLPKTLPYNDYTTITDLPRFIDEHIRYVDQNAPKRTYMPYLDRLLNVMDILKSISKKASKLDINK